MRRGGIGLAAVLLTAGIVATGLWALEGTEPDTAGSDFSATPLNSIDTTALTVARAEFCSAVDPREVEAALLGEAVEHDSYANGDEVTLTEGLTDVAHEFGCAWTGADGAVARAWLFVPPVKTALARRLIKSASGTPGCTSSAEPAFGSPSVGLTCREPSPSASYRGLFGDAWLTCEVTPAPGSTDLDQVRARAGGWCVAVARAAAATDPA